jgi:hypothetical protein
MRRELRTEKGELRRGNRAGRREEGEERTEK